jgi:hypothetical protein
VPRLVERSNARTMTRDKRILGKGMRKGLVMIETTSSGSGTVYQPLQDGRIRATYSESIVPIVKTLRLRNELWSKLDIE